MARVLRGWRFVVIACMIAACGLMASLIVFGNARDPFRDWAAGPLAMLSVARIEFEPVYGAPIVMTNSAADIRKVKAWIASATEPSLASWPKTNCTLRFVSPTGAITTVAVSQSVKKDSSNVNGGLGSAQYSFMKYGLIEWSGHTRIASNSPLCAIWERAYKSGEWSWPQKRKPCR